MTESLFDRNPINCKYFKAIFKVVVENKTVDPIQEGYSKTHQVYSRRNQRVNQTLYPATLVIKMLGNR